MILPVLLLSTFALAQGVPEPATSEPPTSTLSEAPAARPELAPLEIREGLKAYRQRAYARAEEHFLKAVAADPQSAAANYYLGYAIYKRVERRPFHPDKARAARYFTAAFTADPRFRPDWGRAK
jgi:tetratricopeptide (TPR) repeat protein